MRAAVINFAAEVMLRIERLRWRLPFGRTARKLLAVQVIANQRRMTFREIDRIAGRLWSGADALYMPAKTKALLFATRTAALSEGERHVKLRLITYRARRILQMSGALVHVCDDADVSPYTGWEKDDVERLVDQAEGPDPVRRAHAVEQLLGHPRLSDFLSESSSSGRGELACRALAILARGR